MYDTAAQAAGIDLSSTSGQEATSGGFQTMPQDTGDELNGRFTALQMYGAAAVPLLTEMADNSDNSLNQIMTISETAQSQLTELESIRNVQIQSMYHLEDISKFASVLPEMADDIKAVKKNTENL